MGGYKVCLLEASEKQGQISAHDALMVITQATDKHSNQFKYVFKIHHWCNPWVSCLNVKRPFYTWWIPMLHVPCLKEALATVLCLCLLFKILMLCAKWCNFLNSTFKISNQCRKNHLCSRQQWKSRWAQTLRRGKSRSCVSRARSYVYFIRYVALQSDTQLGWEAEMQNVLF